MLFILGMACEHAFGRGPFLFLYVSACVTGSLADDGLDVPTVGASGAIFGLAGALISLIVAHRQRIELRDHRVVSSWRSGPIYTLVLGLLSPIVANSCHLGGLLGGLILDASLPPRDLLTDRARVSRPTTHLQSTFALTAP